jgi:hypothetical protein
MHALERKPITEVYAMIGLGLSTAVAADNVPSLRELIRASSPLLFSASLQSPAKNHTPLSQASTDCSSAEDVRVESPKSRLLTPLASLPRRGSSNLLGALAAQADHVRATETGFSTLSGAVGHVRELCKANLGASIRVALGAHIVLGEYALGYSSKRLQSAIEEVTAWLDEATRSTGALRKVRSLGFLFNSWRETKKVEPTSQLCTFLCGRATDNRRLFRDALTRVEEAQDGLSYFRSMFWLISSFHRPCLRFRIVRKVLGLDETFDRDAVFGVVCFALDIVDRMSSGTTVDVVDESTRLEAEAVAFGATRPCFNRGSEVVFGSISRDGVRSKTSGFNSDPVGAKQRHLRVVYRSRANTL